MVEQLTPPARLLSAAKLLVVALLLLRLGGVATAMLPSAGALVLLLVLLFAGQRVAGDLAAHGGRGAVARWRDWGRQHAFALGLAAIALVALSLRAVGLTGDLGHVQVGIDENRLNASVLYLFQTGHINHVTVEHYPGIHYWMLAGTYLLAYLWGLMHEVGRNLADMPAIHFVAFGRAVSALQSTATVVLTGLLGRRLAGARAGLLAAAALALAPLSISLGRQLRNDTAATMFIVAAVLLALGVHRRGFGGWEALLAGAMAGLAAGVKYTGVFVLLPVLAAAVLSEDRQRRATAAGLAVSGFLAAALLSNHFVWADIPNLLDQLADQIEITGAGHWAAQANPAAYHLDILANRVVGWPMLLLGAAALVYYLAAGNARWWLFALYPLSALWFVAQRPSQLPRWVYPEAPFAAVAGAAGLAVLIETVGARLARAQRGGSTRLAVVTVITLLGFAPLLRSDGNDLSRRISPPTWTLAEQWIDDNAGPDDRVLLHRQWLDIDRNRHVVRRAPLQDVLDGGFYELAAYDWIVVPEELLGDPRLGELERVAQFTVDPSWFGNIGPDLAIYRTPEIAPAELPLQVTLTDRDADRFLGHEWPARSSQARRLPDGGASLYLPPLGGRNRMLDIVVQATGEQTPAIELSSAGTALEVTAGGAADGAATFTVELPLRVVGPGVVALLLRPRPDSAPLRVRGFRLYDAGG
ncbi:MAG: glycosyltransferase family 39 protein [Acidobacteriota bacterium]|jgi:hypothetical protein